MRKVAASVAMTAALVLSVSNIADAGNAFGKQCPKATKGAHGECVRNLARQNGQNRRTTTTMTPTTVTPTTVTPAP